MKQQLQALTQGMKTVQETVSQLNAGAKELTSNDGTLKASGTQLAQSGTQIATVVNQMSHIIYRTWTAASGNAAGNRSAESRL